MNADAFLQNRMWLFKGSEYFLYNLVSGEVEQGPLPLSGWGGGTLPGPFKTGIHAALWLGPIAPHLCTFFKDEKWVTMDSTKNFQPVEGPAGVLGHWASGAWTDPSGIFRTPGVPVALHGLGSEFDGKAHFFKDGHYIRHDLHNGQTDCPLTPIAQAWNLPHPFTDQIDFAFYGTGATAENIFFVSGEQYALYDFRTDKVLATGSVEQRFPALAQFLGRPQLFLVEDYTLTTLVGPPHLGRLIDTRSIGAGSTISRILVTETTDSTADTVKLSLFDSQDSSVVTDFYNKLDNDTSKSGESDQYRYQLNASAHGDASATGVWGGEVNARLHVAGDTDTRRQAVGESTFNSIHKQVDESRRNLVRKTFSSEAEIKQIDYVFRQEVFTETNDSDHVRVYQFFEQIEPFVTLLVLTNVRIGFSTNPNVPPRVEQLGQLPALLEDVLEDTGQRQDLAKYIRSELSKVADYVGQESSLLVDDPAHLAVRPNLSTRYEVPMPDGTAQSILVRGYIKSDRSWVEPTFTITCVQS
jgi:hypothetical protein